ncbi:SpaH/EbpB family LPXTG-anchored major pilin [Leucobacter chromiireducens]|uniref:Isopeptide-forming domain-containing fimbrial protein n=1 Tax=Leucobacter chromiireducens subsp. chromiireducens TaxID=660067 RepID=A0ABS1SMS6_9MICO|nr:SpaH/EbpB family LPXTG-anchored major pilin [Leucobacter chromiireducens]MBL3689478.1 isopeptide-forming domain-containing fimbrial protein [Leucobacter chromiireducens subsp. chromiireducens]
MSVPTNRGTRVLAAGGVLALGLAGMLATTTAANATDAAPGNIDTSVTDGSIIIHKHETIDPAIDGDPKTGAYTGGDAIDGAGFTAWPITSLNLTDAADWDGLSALAAQVNASGACEVPGETLGTSLGEQVTTGGLATFPGLTVGAYLVCETTLPDGASVGSAPFIVTVPSPYAGEWLYDVHVFPKNTLNVVEKTVDAPDGYGLGSKVSFPVSTTINPLPSGDPYTSFIISDTLDSRLGTPTVESVQIDGVDVPYTLEGAGNNLIVVVDPAAVNANIGGTIEVVFSGIVESLGTGSDSGEISNTATLFVNDPNQDGEGVPSNTVTTKWGDLTISKVDADSTSTGLVGALFEVYESSDPYAADCSTTTPGAGPIEVNGDTEFASVTGGIVNIGGLYVTDSSNTPNDTAAERCYFVKETQAPAGFVTPTGDAAFTAVSVTPGVSSAADVVIENTKQSVPELPLTGGAGQAGLIAGGIALLVAGVAFAAARRRKVEA